MRKYKTLTMVLVVILSVIAYIMLLSFKPTSNVKTVAVTTNSAQSATTIINKMCNNGWTLDKVIEQPVATSIDGNYFYRVNHSGYRETHGNLILIFKQ